MSITVGISNLLILLLAAPSWALAQNGGPSNEQWTIAKSIHSGDKLIVDTKAGQRVQGPLGSVTDTSLTLLNRNKTIEINRSDVRRVSRDGGTSATKAVWIGAAVGAGAGAGIGAAAGCGHCLASFSRTTTIPAGSAAGAIVGALGGWVIGKLHHKKSLVFETR